MLFSLLILGIILYTLWDNKQNKKPIIIKPIKIAPLSIKEEPSLVHIAKPTKPSDILLKLKIATSKSQEKHEQNEEKLVNKILNNLKKQADKQIKVAEYKQKKKPIVIVKQVQPKIKKTIAKVIKKPTIAKIKKIEQQVQVLKKIAVKKKKVSPVKIKEILQKPNNTKVTTNIKTIKKIKLKTIKKTAKVQKQLSREEEVALYKSQYANKLEVVGVSENFEIEEVTNNLPDSYYFETQEVSKSDEGTNAPLNYVKKLGVVDVSNAYEVNFTIPD
jgi:tRNA U34 5-methylaminomethyl-2-thiouridine-forming methyltransferase MnmC